MSRIIYQNDENTVRIREYFLDRAGIYEYGLQHKREGLKLFGYTIIKDYWDSGFRAKAHIMPILTKNKSILNKWIKHYKLKKVSY